MAALKKLVEVEKEKMEVRMIMNSVVDKVYIKNQYLSTSVWIDNFWFGIKN